MVVLDEKLCELQRLCELAKNLGCDVFLDEPLAKHSTFKIGGPADVFIKPCDLNALEKILKCCCDRKINDVVVGNGSNILFKDEGFRGVVLNIGSKMESLEIQNETETTAEIVVSAGTTLAKLAHFAMENSLTGLEFCWGIPGTVGGGVFMNAGAYGGEMKDVIVSSSYIDKNSGEKKVLQRDQMNLGYRHSCYMEEKLENNCVITEARFKLSRGESSEINAKMKELMERRKSKQPLEWPNAGSVFKRPEGNFAGTLIEKSGLKGVFVGGAKVSEKHAGFIVNTGGATAKDVLDLIEVVRREVLEKTGYCLEPELKVI